MKTWINDKTNIFTITTMVALVLILLPLSNMFSYLFTETSEQWVHIRTHLLFEYITNSLLLLFIVGIISSIIGFASAYFVTFYEFKGRKLFSWIMILPIAVPSYIAAYVYGDMFSYTGTISVFLRSIGINYQIDVLSLFGAAVIFSVTLYPYVFMVVKSSLKKHSSLYIENAKLLRASPIRILTEVTIPLSRPAIVGGTTLVLLEVLNDYGVVSYFGVRVFSFAIFDAWFRLRDLPSAVRISAVALIVVFIIIMVERYLRGRRSYASNTKTKPIHRIAPSTRLKVVIYMVLLSVFSFGFLIPVLEMISNLIPTYQTILKIEFLYIVINTLSISIVSTLIIIFLAVMITNYGRLSKSKYKLLVTRITSIGYAIPGAVIAVSVLVFFVDLDNLLYPIYKIFDEDTKKLVLTTSLSMLMFAYTLRFLTIASNTVESTYEKISKKYTEAAYTLRSSKIRTLLQVDLPLIKEGLIAAFIIVFIDVIKELPLTLILRPTNYNTIATSIYTYASDEMIQEASGPSLLLILICSIMVYFITHQKRGVKHVSKHEKR